MNALQDSTSSSIVMGLGDFQTANLLRLGFGGQSRPIDRLIARLEADDGVHWLASALTEIPIVVAAPGTWFARSGSGLTAHDVFIGSGPVESRKADRPGGRPPAEQHLATLRAIKHRCKQIVSSPRNEEQMLVGTLGYFLTVAAGALHHRVQLSSRPADELDAALLDLASVLPEPWCDLMNAAAGELQSLPGQRSRG